MTESTKPAQCRDEDWSMARNCGLMGATPGTNAWDAALGRFADGVRAALAQQAQGEAKPVEELAMMVRLLVHALRKAAPANPLSARAVDYLQRHGLQGSVLRAAPSASPDTAEEDAYVIDRLGKLLAGVAIALKGPDLAQHRHSYHDLVEVAERMVLELELYRATYGEKPPAASSASPASAQQDERGAIYEAAQKLHGLASDLPDAWLRGQFIGIAEQIVNLCQVPSTAPAVQADGEAVPFGLIDALRFYANGSHFILSDDTAWDTVSGEPPNFWCDEAGTATIEDGSVAKLALQGHFFTDQEYQEPAVEGEVFKIAASHPSPATESASTAALMDRRCQQCNAPRKGDTCQKCGAATVEPCAGWEEPALPPVNRIRELAREIGYAVGVHGTLERDLDLIAAPWSEEAAKLNCREVMQHIADGLGARLIDVEGKPLGRRACTIQMDGWYKPIDLSVCPMLAASPAKENSNG